MLRLFVTALCITSILVIAQAEPTIGFEGIRSDSKITHRVIAFTMPSIEFIGLKRRNWENHGTDMTINSKWHYEITSVSFGKTKKIREGSLTQEQMNDLAQLIETSGFYESQNEYYGPFKTEFSWCGYQLTVKTKQGVKSVKFHSEDNTVPEKLKELVEFLIQSTK